MNPFFSRILLDFFTAFGIVLGGTILAGISSVIILQPPIDTMRYIAEHLKIWAVVAAIGGTIDPIRVMESNFWMGNLNLVCKQLLYIFVSFLGAHFSTQLIYWVCRDRM